MNQQQANSPYTDDAGKILCCRTAHRPAVNIVSAVTPQRAIINIDSIAVCYTNEPAAGTKFM
jgi:hypothetical protein